MSTRHAHLKSPVSEHDHADGPADAAVTLVEYGDFECSHCGQAYPIVKEIQARLRGRLRFVFRNFPLTHSHAHALSAAEAAEAAAAQGKFWEMHGTLFEHQKRLDDAHLIEYARSVGLDEPRFVAEMEARAHFTRVEAQFNGGVDSGVHATPTFFINGVRHDGSWDFETLLTGCLSHMKT
ncbi:MAG TPA: thioredoxin domain-containing protein [Vicinamibacterales bacterium]|nr:thioredoxin domain-containing protein [Vicinamibacterales bacterium]